MAWQNDFPLFPPHLSSKPNLISPSDWRLRKDTWKIMKSGINWRYVALVVAIINAVMCSLSITTVLLYFGRSSRKEKPSWSNDLETCCSIIYATFLFGGPLLGIVLGSIVILLLCLAMLILDICIMAIIAPTQLLEEYRRACRLVVIVWLVCESISFFLTIVHIVIVASLYSDNGEAMFKLGGYKYSHWEYCKPIIQILMILLMIPFACELSKSWEQEPMLVRMNQVQPQLQVQQQVQPKLQAPQARGVIWKGRESFFSIDSTDDE